MALSPEKLASTHTARPFLTTQNQSNASCPSCYLVKGFLAVKSHQIGICLLFVFTKKAGFSRRLFSSCRFVLNERQIHISPNLNRYLYRLFAIGNKEEKVRGLNRLALLESFVVKKQGSETKCYIPEPGLPLRKPPVKLGGAPSAGCPRGYPRMEYLLSSRCLLLRLRLPTCAGPKNDAR